MLTGHRDTLPEAVAYWARHAPDRVVLCDGDTEFSAAALHAEIETTARRLVAVGVSPGQPVLLVSHNIWQWVSAFLALLRIGAIAVPMNNRLAASQVGDLVRLLGAELALADSEHAALFGETRLTVRGLGCDVASGDLWEASLAPVTLPDLPGRSAIALVSFTSGTTGTPKGAVLTHGAIATAGQLLLERMGLGADDSTLVVAPLFHNTGFIDQLALMLLGGGRVDLLRRYSTRAAVAAFRRRPATYLAAVPSVLRMLALADEADHVFRSMRTIMFGGSPMPAAWSAELTRRWPHLQLWHGYGLTEFSSCCTLLPPELSATHGESIGHPLPGVELRLVDEQGHDIPAGATGEIWVAGAPRMLEYWAQPEATSRKLAGEWLRTGDLARFNDDGLLYHVGRVDDVINRGGEKILPSYVEAVLAQHPGIADGTVFALPDPVLQNRVLAAVEVRPGAVVDPADVREFAAGRLPSYAVPEHIFVHARLPRTASGKLDRKAVQALHQGGAGPGPSVPS